MKKRKHTKRSKTTSPKQRIAELQSENFRLSKELSETNRDARHWKESYRAIKNYAGRYFAALAEPNPSTTELRSMRELIFREPERADTILTANFTVPGVFGNASYVPAGTFLSDNK